MGRKIQHNNIVTDELLAQCNKENIELGNDFLDYLRSVDRSPNTINAYRRDLYIFWVYLLQHCDNKFFIDLSKRDIARYQSFCLTEYKWSPARMRRVKSTLSSLSNYVEAILDDEYENFKPIIRKIENPSNEKVFTKTVLSDEQVQGMLDYWVEKGKYDKACILALAAFSGRRKSELPRFKVSYFDDENIIYGSLYKTPEKIQTKGRGSRGKMLVVYTLAKPFKPYFDLWMNYRKEHGIESEWLFPKKVNGEYIDEPMDSSTLDSWADTFSKHLGEDFYFHSLRHFFTTSCYQTTPWNEGAYSCAIRQYSSVGKLNGYNGHLDLNKAYFDKAQWKKYASKTGVISSISSIVRPITKPVASKPVTSSTSSIIKKGQTEANKFAGCNIIVDGIRGIETKKAAVKVVQTGLNKDYGAGLTVDGIWGFATDAAFGSHYVKVSECQWMVTALEILCLLKGKNPKGVEYPGVFGQGLKKACGTSKAVKKTFKDLCS